MRERGSSGTLEQGNANIGTGKNKFVQERRNAERKAKTEEPRNAGREGSTGTQLWYLQDQIILFLIFLNMIF